MEKFWEAEQFYPTPKSLLEKIIANDGRKIQLSKFSRILEPSAGKGDIADFLKAKMYEEAPVDCIEINENLRATLKGKGYPVIGDDFLSFQTFYHYDLIFMNPPFANGAAHLLKALQMQKNGGSVICILNANTIENPCTSERKMLVSELEKYDAVIKFYDGEFSTAENPTGVRIAVIMVEIPQKTYGSEILDGLKRKEYTGFEEDNMTQLEPGDYIKAIIAHYNFEIEAGLKLIREAKAMEPLLMTDVKTDKYSKPILELKCNEKDASNNRFIRAVRKKYWSALFADARFTGKMTSNLLQEYMGMIEKLKDYDFSSFNIMQVQNDISRRLATGVEECIMALFDKLSCQYAYTEYSSNVHYYNGWKTNKAWYINSKVIIPFYGFSPWSGNLNTFECSQMLGDIEKALAYLDTGAFVRSDYYSILDQAEKSGSLRNISFRYFTISLYKKGTCHIVFKDEDLLKKLNIFGSMKRGWLPQGYGKKGYNDFSEEEKEVIDDFQGQWDYSLICQDPKKWIFDPTSSLNLIEMQ